MKFRPPKTLIIFDSNKIRSIIYGGPRYDLFDLGTDFKNLRSFIEENDSKNLFNIAIPELVLEELLIQKLDQYKEDIQEFPKIKERICRLPISKFGDIVIPSNDFDCKKYLYPLIEKFLRENKILVIKIEERNKKKIFEDLLKRAKNGDPPFKGKIVNEKNENSDAGFKDAIIWETIINWKNINDFQNIFFICGDKGFKVKDEFIKKFKNKKFEILGDIKLLEFYLRDIKDEAEIKNFLFSNYFKEKFRSYILDFYDLKIEKGVKIIPSTLRIEEAKFQDLEDIQMVDSEGNEFKDIYGDKLQKIKIINFNLKGKKEYLAEVFLEKNDKEIIFGRADFA